MSKNYYEILGVDKDASPEVIKKQYRKLSKLYHPDVKPNDKEAEEKFKEIAQAYEILSDKDKKSNYDRFGDSKARPRQENYSHFHQYQSYNQKVGDNMNLLVKLTLEEIFTGVKKKYKYQRNDNCDVCSGHGGTDSQTCNTCNGQGQVIREIRTPIGVMRQVFPCPSCDGSGATYKHQCNSCSGSGLKSIEETVEIDIPSGVQEGMTFIMSGKGHSIKGGVAGDLHINVMELQHKIYTRNLNDLKMNLKLSYSQLVLGDKVEIDTIEGRKIRITIPEYSDVGSNLRIQNKGLKAYNKDTRGDIVVTLGINIPKEVNEETKEILKKLK